MKANSSRQFEFGAFKLDSNTRKLSDDRRSVVQISAQAFNTLVYLLRHAGRVVERAELMYELWPDSVVEDNSLNRVMVLLRRALGDGYIVTVKGRGYQFVAAVRVPNAGSSQRPEAGPAKLTFAAISTRLRIVLAGMFVTALIVASFTFLRVPAARAPDPLTRFSQATTDNERALQFYLSARNYESMQHDSDIELASRQYQRAVEQDPEFALAWARLSIAHNEIFWFRKDVSTARRQLAYDAAMRAVKLEPELAEARMALGWYYYHIDQNYESAIAELEQAASGMPEDSEVYWRLGIVHRRYGDIGRALAAFDRAAVLDPLIRDNVFAPAELFVLMRNYVAAEALLDRILALSPDHGGSLTYTVMIPLYRDGDVSALKMAAHDERFDARSILTIPQPIMGWIASIYEKKFDQALEYLDTWEEGSWQDGRYFSRDGLYALTYELADRRSEAVDGWQSALAHIEGVLDQNPDYPEAWMARAEALAWLGQRESAIKEAHRVIAHFSSAGDRISEAEHRLDAVRRVFVPVGALDDAFAELDRYFAGNGNWSIEGLMDDPRLEAVRGDPRFTKLYEQYRRR